MNKTEELFLDDLNQLLRMYKVELSVDRDHMEIRAWAYAQYNKYSQEVSGCIDLNLGGWLNGE